MNDRQFGLRELLGAVNLRDFVDMVGAEVGHIGNAAGLAVQSLTRLPFGPFAFVIGIAIVGFRSCLLVLVVIVFGTGILAISIARTVLGLMGRRPAEPREDEESPPSAGDTSED